MSEGSFWPKSWREALPLLVWGVLIFAFGFEGVASLIHGEWWQTLFGFGGMVGLTAMLIYGARIRDNLADLRWLIAASMVALIVVALSPYIEQRRWPFSKVIHDPPTADDIAKAVAPIQAQLDAAKRDLTAKEANRKKTSPYYDPSEIREMLLALRTLRELANKDVAPAVIPQTNLINEWKRALDSVGAAAMAEKLKEMAAAMRAAEGKVSQLRQDEWHYADELKPVFGDLNALSAAQGTALDLAEQLGKYAKAQNVDISELVHDRAERWQISVGKAYSWVTNTNNQIDAKTKQLRELAQ